MAVNKFDQLVEDMVDNKLTLNLIQMAIRSYIRRRKDISEGSKNILCGTSDDFAGLIYKMFKPIQEMIGSVELAYQRGTQAGREDEEKRVKRENEEKRVKRKKKGGQKNDTDDD